jgi:hypothetical protein
MMKLNRLFLLAVLTATILATTIQLPAPAHAQTSDPVLVGAGDIANCGKIGDEDTAKLLDSISGTVFTFGDNVYPDGTAAQFTDCYGPSWGRHKARTMPAPGNHDYHTTGAAGYFGYFGQAASPLDNNCTSNCKGYYSYNLGTWHIVVINSETDFSLGSAQDKWLRADLAANQTACTLAYWHEPLYSSGTHGNATRVRPLWNALYQYGADVVLNGHDHRYERFAPQNPNGQADPKGIREFVVGTGGSSLYLQGILQPNSEISNDTTWGVLQLTLHPGSYNWEFVPIAGQNFRDAGSANCVTSGSGGSATQTPTAVSGPTATDTPTALSGPTATDTPTALSGPTATDTPTAAPSTPIPTLPSATATAGGSTSDLIFADGFESGSLVVWTTNKTDLGDLSVSPGAALQGSQGMQALIDDTIPIYVTDDKPVAEPRYRARFYFDPNSISMASGDAHFIFMGYIGTSTAVLRLEFQQLSGLFKLRARLINDAGTWLNTAWFTISDGPHPVEIDWRAATSAGANNGGLTLWIDGVQQAAISNVDNDTRKIDRVRLGALAGIDTGTLGMYYFDAFESRRQSYIGPLQ